MSGSPNETFEPVTFDGILFERSDVLEFDVGETSVTLRLVAEISEQHPAFEPGQPPSGICLREVLISFDSVREIRRSLSATVPEIDPEGGAHFGRLYRFERRGYQYTMMGGFGALEFRSTKDPTAQVMAVDYRVPEPSIGIALSGGGHRATAWALGTLLYLVDSGCNKRVTSIASVSGGSLANAYVALLKRSFNRMDAEQFEQPASRLANLLAGSLRTWWITALGFLVIQSTWLITYWTGSNVGHSWWFAGLLGSACCLWLVLIGPRSGGSLWGWGGTWLYVGSIGTIFFWFPALWLLPITELQRLLVLGILVLTLILLISLRHVVAGLAFGNTVCAITGRPRGHAARLEEMHSEVQHVFCATEVHAGQHVYFSNDFIYNRSLGIGVPGSLRVRTAVQASANFPGGFPLRILRSTKFNFFLKESGAGNWMILTDGGVYDNFGDSWFTELDECIGRLRAWTSDEKRVVEAPAWVMRLVERWTDRFPYQLVVMNASPQFEWQSLAWAWVPVIGEPLSFAKVVNVMYNNTSGYIKDDLWREAKFFRLNVPASAATVVDIQEDPFTTLATLDATYKGDRMRGEFTGTKWLQQAVGDRWRQRSAAALDSVDYHDHCLPFYFPRIAVNSENLPHVMQSWAITAHRNASIGTHLNPLGVTQTATLLYHAYVNAMFKLHARFGFPLVDPVPTLADFIPLAEGKTRPRKPLPRLGPLADNIDVTCTKQLAEVVESYLQFPRLVVFMRRKCNRADLQLAETPVFTLYVYGKQGKIEKVILYSNSYDLVVNQSIDRSEFNKNESGFSQIKVEPQNEIFDELTSRLRLECSGLDEALNSVERALDFNSDGYDSFHLTVDRF